ncbi:MAG: hypothetical protein WCI50_10980 [Actinomycetes bacterium]
MIQRSPTLATFAVMLVAIVGGGVLALPIALSQFGPVPAGIVVVLMGILSTLTMATLTKAVTRSATVAAGRGRLVTMTSEHLGPLTTRTTTGVSIVNWLGHLVVYFLGLAGTLAAVFGGATALWSVGIGVLVTLLILLQARKVFIASASVVAAVNLVLLVALVVIVATHVDTALIRIGDFGGSLHGLDEWRNALRLVFGAILWAYFGHTAIFAIAPEILKVEPSGRALLRGSVSAMIAATVINVTWVVVVLGSIPGSALERNESTGVTIIARTVGGPFTVIATLFVILAIGGGAANSAFALTDVVAELLPDNERFVALLRPGVSIEADEPTTATRIVITVVEREHHRQLIARARRGEHVVTEDINDMVWDSRALLERVGGMPRRHWLRVTNEGTLPDGVLVRVDATMPLTQHPVGAEPWWHRAPEQNEIAVMRAVTRQPDTAAKLAARLGLGPDVLEPITQRLLTQGSIRVDPDGRFRAVLGTKRRMRSSTAASRLDVLFDLDGESGGESAINQTTGADRALDASARLQGLLSGAKSASPAASRLDALAGLDEPATATAATAPSPAASRLDALAGLDEPATPAASRLDALAGLDEAATPPATAPSPAPSRDLAAASVDEQLAQEEVVDSGGGSAGIFQSESVRHLVRITPVLAAIVITLGCIALSFGFTDLLSLIAIATIMFLGGVLPVLLGLSLRVRAERRGVPGLTWVWALWTLFGIYAAASGIYAIFIYRDVVPRVISALALALSLACMVSARKFGAFHPRSTMAVEFDPDGNLETTFLVAGTARPVSAPDRTADSMTSLVAEGRGPVVSPLLVAARQGDSVPAELETWQVTIVDRRGTERFVAEGTVSDVTGDLVEVPDDVEEIRVRWTFR